MNIIFTELSLQAEVVTPISGKKKCLISKENSFCLVLFLFFYSVRINELRGFDNLLLGLRLQKKTWNKCKYLTSNLHQSKLCSVGKDDFPFQSEFQRNSLLT